MKLSQLHALVAVAESCNFSEAALQLGISQSAVSHAIAVLEEELGIVLFLRGRHGAKLTPVGERIADSARQMVQLETQIRQQATLERGLQGGQVRVASFRSVATHILPKAIAQFRQKFPAIAVIITEHEDYPKVEQAIQEGKADVGFTLLPTCDDLETWELLHDEYVALLPPDFKPAGPQLTWDELTAYPLIMPPESHSCCERVLSHTAAHGKPLKITYEVREDSTTVNMVTQGLGASIMPRLAAEPIPALVQVHRLPDPLVRVIGIAVRANALLSPAVFAFLEVLRKDELAFNESK